MRTQSVLAVCIAAVIGTTIQGALAFMIARQLFAPAAPMPVAQAPAFNPGIVMEGGPGDVAVMPEMPVQVFAPAGQQAAQPCTKEELNTVRGAAVETAAYELSGPFTHKNLSVFFIHGPNAGAEQKIITLEEAINQNLAVVHDTGFQLSVDNRSGQTLFIQGGDIVKGGNQDRVLPYDYMIPAGANRSPVAAFCVESGRSSPRGNEISSSFQVSSTQLPTRSLKLAAMVRRSQSDVWSGVAQTQANLSRNVGGSVQAAQSRTSLQLTLEHPLVSQAAQGYVNEISPRIAQKDNAIGFVVAINGKVQSADVYASSDLFRSLWPKLMQASAVAALAEQSGTNDQAPTTEAVQSFLADAETGQAYRQGSQLRRESGRSILLESCTAGQNNLVVHRCFLAK